MRLAQEYLRRPRPEHVRRRRPRLRAAVPGHRREQGARRPRPAVSARRPGNCRTPPPARRSARPRPATPAAPLQIYLNVAGRDPAEPAPADRRPRSTPQQRTAAATEVDAKVARIKAAFRALTDTNDWNRDGQPEGWKVIDRAFTKAEARYIPNGAGSTADMAHPTRTGDVVAFSYPPYQFDAATPGTLIAPSAFFGQHGYVPDVQDLRSNTNMRATFLAGGTRSSAARSRTSAPSTSRRQRRSCSTCRSRSAPGRRAPRLLDDGRDFTPMNVVGLNDFHGQLDPSTRRCSTRTRPCRSAAPRNSRPCSTRRPRALPGQTLLLAGGDNVGASPPTRRCCEDMPTIDVPQRLGAGRDRVRQPRVRLRARRGILKQQARVEVRLAVGEHRRDGHRPPAVLREAVEGRPRQRREGRRHRRDGQEHAGARGRGQHRRA